MSEAVFTRWDELSSGRARQEDWSTGHEAIDSCLPAGGLGRAALHEVEPLRPTDMPWLTGFAFGLLSRLASMRPIVWCVTRRQVGDCGHLHASGLQRYGISPAQVVFARVDHPLHLHFAMEEALKTSGVGAVIGEGPRPTFTGSRRLSMLARAEERPCLLMIPDADGGRGSAAETRWQVEPQPGVSDPLDPFGPGLPTWRVALPRMRGGRSLPHMEPGSSQGLSHGPAQAPARGTASYPWRVVWDEQTYSFRPAAAFSSQPADAGTAQAAPARQTVVGGTRRAG